MTISGITLRQRQVLWGVAAGLTNQQIGDMLGISPYTVKTHMLALYAKLGGRKRDDLPYRFHHQTGGNPFEYVEGVDPSLVGD